MDNVPSPQSENEQAGYAVSLSGQSSWTTPSVPDSRDNETVVPPLSFTGTPAVSGGETQAVGYASPAYPTIPAPPSLPSRRSTVPRWAWLVGVVVLVLIIIMLVVAFLLLNVFVLHLF